jgi:hypothetical protein
MPPAGAWLVGMRSAGRAGGQCSVKGGKLAQRTKNPIHAFQSRWTRCAQGTSKQAEARKQSDKRRRKRREKLARRRKLWRRRAWCIFSHAPSASTYMRPAKAWRTRASRAAGAPDWQRAGDDGYPKAVDVSPPSAASRWATARISRRCHSARGVGSWFYGEGWGRPVVKTTWRRWLRSPTCGGDASR